MSNTGTIEPPLYAIPFDGQEDGRYRNVYNLHTPFTPPRSGATFSSQLPVFTSSGGAVGSGLESGDGKKKFVSYDTPLEFSPGMTICTSCQQQVMTNVTYKAGTFAWVMCTLIVFLGLTLCLLPLCLLFLIPKFKDAHHTCPRCDRVLHIEKRKCCK